MEWVMDHTSCPPWRAGTVRLLPTIIAFWILVVGPLWLVGAQKAPLTGYGPIGPDRENPLVLGARYGSILLLKIDLLQEIFDESSRL
jgi:hypothetical protein